MPKQFLLGTNPSGFPRFETQNPFKDFLKKSKGWDNTDGLTLDANGYPTDITGASGPVLIRPTNDIQRTPYFPAGRWVITYDGEGTLDVSAGQNGATDIVQWPGRVEFTVNSPSTSGLRIDLNATTVGNHLKNMKVFLADDEATLGPNPFRTDFLDYHDSFGTIRFMGWQQAGRAGWMQNSTGDPNTLDSTTQVTLTDDGTFVNQDDFYNGWIMMIQLAADGSFITRRVLDQIGLVLTLESAHPWGGSFPQACDVFLTDYIDRTWADRTLEGYIDWTTYGVGKMRNVPVEVMVDLANITKKNPWFCMPVACDDDYVTQFATFVKNNLDSDLTVYVEYANELWNTVQRQWSWVHAVGDIAGLAFWEQSATRMVEIWNLWSDVYLENHLRADRPDSALKRVMAWHNNNPSVGVNVMDYVVGLNAVSEYADVAAIAPYFRGVDKAAHIADIDADFAVDGNVTTWKANADARGLPLACYEGGQHNTDADADQAEQEYQYEVYNHFLAKWKALETGEPFVHLGDTSRNVGDNRFGSRNYWDQPISEAPRWRALSDFHAANDGSVRNVADSSLKLWYRFAQDKSSEPAGGLGPTLSLASAVGQRNVFDENGILQDVPDDTSLRFDHDVEGNFLGMLLEKFSRNECLHNRDLTDAAWVKSNMIVARDATGLRNDANGASTLTATAANATAIQSITLTSAERCFSAWVRRKTGGGTLEMTDDTGTNWTALSGISSVIYTQHFITRTQTDPAIGFRIATSGDEFEVDFCQLESGARPTSPIETAAAAVERASEDLTMADVSAYHEAEGTLYVHAIVDAVSPVLMEFDDGSGDNRVSLNLNTNDPRLFVRAAASTVANLDAGTWATGAEGRLAGAYKLDDFAAAHDGGAVVTDVLGAVPTGIANFRLGRSVFGGFARTHFKEVRYYNERKSDQFVEDLAAGLVEEVLARGAQTVQVGGRIVTVSCI